MNGLTLSSTAERIYWLGRYLERSETMARLVIVHANLLIDMPKRLPLGWRPLVEITGNAGEFAKLYDEMDEKNVCRFLINDARSSGSLLNSLSWVRENARTVRGFMPLRAFEYFNEIYLLSREKLTEPLSRSRRLQGLTEIVEHVQRIDGFMSANMLHDAHWNFLRIGQFIERADMTTRIIDVGTGTFWEGATDLEPFADVQWRSVLRSLFALQSYNTTVGEPISQGPVIDFLLNDSRLPRSVDYGLMSVRNNLRSLPRNERPLRAVNRIRRSIAHSKVRTLSAAELNLFLDECQIQISQLHNEIHTTYFDFKPRRRSSKQRQKQTRVETSAASKS